MSEPQPFLHDSDCALYNAPALPVGPCNCSARWKTMLMRMKDLAAEMEFLVHKDDMTGALSDKARNAHLDAFAMLCGGRPK